MPRAKSTDPKKNTKLSANATPEEVKRYNDACATLNMSPGDTLRKLASAFAECVEQTGQVVLPIKIFGPASKG